MKRRRNLLYDASKNIEEANRDDNIAKEYQKAAGNKRKAAELDLDGFKEARRFVDSKQRVLNNRNVVCDKFDDYRYWHKQCEKALKDKRPGDVFYYLKQGDIAFAKERQNDFAKLAEAEAGASGGMPDPEFDAWLDGPDDKLPKELQWK